MRTRFLLAAAGASLLSLLAGCGETESGPVAVSVIGGPPEFANPSRGPLDPPSAYLLQNAAQGLVRFSAAGEIEPALAQRWIVSDDGLRYIFRLSRATWPNGDRVTAEQVAARLRAAAAPSSRNPLKPLLGAVHEIVAIADVVEISLRSPRPNFLQLLAQPELAILRGTQGSGPYRVSEGPPGALLLTIPPPEDEEEEDDQDEELPEVLLRGERAAMAIARFTAADTALVLGGTLADLPLARAAGVPATGLAFDPVAGLFGLAFLPTEEGPLADPAVRRALSMAIDRAALVAALRVPNLQPRDAILPPGIADQPQPALPAWGPAPLSDRRAAAASAIAALDAERPLPVRIAMPDAPGYRLLFAHIRRDWAAIGVRAERVDPGRPADLRLVDEVAPASLASWYLRHFTCDQRTLCNAAADELLAAARIALTPLNRRALLANAERILADQTVFIPIAAPVRWSLVSPRLTGFRINPFGRHPAAELIRPR